MNLYRGLCLALLFCSCAGEDAPIDTTAADSPVVQETAIDTFVIGKRSGVVVNESSEGESLRVENDSVIENIRFTITGNQPAEDDILGTSSIVKNPDVAPSFPGGSAAMDAYIARNLVYPLVAMQNDVVGVVNIRFVIESDGRLSGITVQKGLGFGCDEAAIDLIQGMPKWVPGKKAGVNVRTSVVLPLSFHKPEE